MNALSKREAGRTSYCEQFEGSVSQKIYYRNSSGEPVWGCIGPCSVVDCEYNKNPKSEAHRYNLYG